MIKLLRLIWWDSKLIIKSGVVAVAAGITVLYLLLIYFGGLTDADQWIILLLISDPVMYGFMFSAIIVLFEKDIHIHQVFATIPLPKSYYLISKSIVFVLLSLFCCLPIVWVYQPQQLNWFWLILAILFSSVLFSLIGMTGAMLSQNFNQFILTIPIVLAPAALPFLSLFNLVDSFWFYIIPTQACLLLFQGAFQSIPIYQTIYAVLYLTVFTGIMFYWTNRLFHKTFR